MFPAGVSRRFPTTDRVAGLQLLIRQSAQITAGEDLVSTFLDTVQDSGNTLHRHFCAKCSAPLFITNGDFGRTLAVFYSALDDFNVEGEEHKPPQMEYYTKDRTDWVRAFDSTAKQAETKPGRN